ncbi:IS701 family transposase [Streptomyces yaizuensis]|uniref:Transposase n=1 Tax=Streptomyces yaizuensis TaxID=2989713 RepID=A0ABQ5PA14_9ACTN|nr:transposase [Streptomyces sp. YSPA8]GLF99412.1 transposase [Streptomyces sp. YSPA8]
MSTVSPRPAADLPTLWSPPPAADEPEPYPLSADPEAVLGDLCVPLFRSLRRSDQRRRGMEYIHGLLSTQGRKSIRNMAALIGGSGTGQSLHHFICSSTWDWTPVRRAMAQYTVRAAPPQAWVARPMTIPKVGQHSVGVSRYFSPDEGQALNAQRAIGVWAASDRTAVPLNWRLHLPQIWIKDGLRRNQASIPCEIEPETLSDCALAACREMLGGDWGLPTRPVVIDIGEADPLATVGALHTAGIPSLIRVSGELRLGVSDRALTGHGAQLLPAGEIMRAARNMRRPVVWRQDHPHPRLRTSLITTVRVTAPGPHPLPSAQGRPGTERDGSLLLVGVGAADQRWPAELWLTDLPASQATAVPQLSSLTQRVDRAFDEITDQVGIRDYVGRSYSGWHRHVTLASAAHTVAALSASAAARRTVPAARAS